LPFWTVADAIARIGRLRRARPGSMWLDVFLPEHDASGSDQALHHKAALAATLIAGLELLTRKRLVRTGAREGTKVRFSPFSNLDCFTVSNRCYSLRPVHDPCAPCPEGSRRQAMALAIMLLGAARCLKGFHMSDPKLLPIIHHIQIRR
jgi:hypothetical protein